VQAPLTLRSYEKLKKLFADKDGNLSIPARLAAGAGAACFSTVVRGCRAACEQRSLPPQVTYPLDIIRFRMAVDPTLNTIPQVIRSVIRDEGVWAFYKGLLPSCVGIAPYSSINFAAFDLCARRGAGAPAHPPAAGSRRPCLRRWVATARPSSSAPSPPPPWCAAAGRLHAAAALTPRRRRRAAATRWTPSGGRCR